MNRLFDTNLLSDDGWTEGEEWSKCNTPQDFNEVFHRFYGSSDEDDVPNYRISPGDNFYIAANKEVIRDWHPIRDPWYLDIAGTKSAPFSIYFGIQKGVSDIDTTLDNHAPYIVGNVNSVFDISADHFRFFGLKMKDSDPAITLSSQVEGITVQGAVLVNTPLIKTEGYRMIGWVLRNITFIGVVAKMLDVPLASSNVSIQDINSTGEGDCGLSVADGHSEIEVIALTIDNEYHQYDEDKVLYHGVFLGAGSKATVRYITINGFSGNAFKFYCEVDVKGLVFDKCGTGIYFGENATARDCMVTFLRQIEGDSYGYYFEKDGELNNCGCNLDETGGLGVVVLGEGSTVTVNGGDYQLNLPLPFATAIGNSTIVLNNVTMNGVLYNETIELALGESWRGEKAEVVRDSLPVYANSILYMPFEHIPNMREAVSVQGNNDPFNSVIKLPSGAEIAPDKSSGVRYNPKEAFLHLNPGESVIDYFRYSTEFNIYTHQFEIHASDEVGAMVVQPDAFSGSGWSKSGSRYTASNTSTSLSANYSFEEDEVYQISIKLEGQTAGGVLPSIGSAQGQYSHYLEGTEVWLIRAPANATAITIAGQSYSGDLLNVYVRKLLRTETPAIPELEATVSGSDVELIWYLDPIARLKDLEPPRVTVTELTGTGRDGYFDRNGGSYLFENVSSVGKKTAINLRGGDNLDVWKLNVIGGYTGAYDTYQNAISPEMNTGPYFNRIQVCYVTGDLGLNSNYGGYTSEFGNCDILIFNGLTNAETYAAEAYVLGMDGRHSTDGVIDTKKRTEVNHSLLIGAYRQIRLHNVATGLVANCEFIRVEGTKECIAPTKVRNLTDIWNCHFDDQRAVTTDQLKNQVNSHHTAYSEVGVISVHAGAMSILKTYPTISDYCRVAMTDMEFQIKSSGGSGWYNLSLQGIDLPGVVGCFKRTFALSGGEYQIRCRCYNGALIGAWSNEITITV